VIPDSLTIDAARSSIQERTTTALALAEAHYARIQKEDGEIGAFLTLCKERALAQADRIDRMAEIAAVYPLPRGFTGDERRWYRGLAYLDDSVIPVVEPTGFLTPEEFQRLDRASAAAAFQRETEAAVQA